MSEQLVFEDVTDQWEIREAFLDRGWTIFAYKEAICVRDEDGDVVLSGRIYGGIHEDNIYACGGTLLATRKKKKPPEPKYVPFENAKEARSVVGCQPYVRPINGDWAGIQMAYVWDWDELCERYMWSNTPDDPSSWKPFGKLVTE